MVSSKPRALFTAPPCHSGEEAEFENWERILLAQPPYFTEGDVLLRAPSHIQSVCESMNLCQGGWEEWFPKPE